MKITRIEPTVATLTPKKKVAAYARVSVESDRLNHSLSAQVSYYSNLIQNNPEWIYVGVYADSGMSGTGKDKRIEFQRMIDECEARRIDIVITKSISRFARNVVDLLQTVRHLKSLGIDVWFEKENIKTLSSDGELLLSLLGSFAQEESQSISENSKWGLRKMFEKGTLRNHKLYGYCLRDGKMTIVPEEAEIIRGIYKLYLAGDSFYMIAKKFNARGIKSCYGKSFSGTVIGYILRQEKYTGNSLLQKYYVKDVLTHKLLKNKGELPMYYSENTHPAIIDKETFDKVQQEFSRRYGTEIKNGVAETAGFLKRGKPYSKPDYDFRKPQWSTKQRLEHGEIYKSFERMKKYRRYPLSLFIKCGGCGENLQGQLRSFVDGTKELRWRCNRHDRHLQEKGITNPVGDKPLVIDDKRIKKMIAEVLGLAEFDVEVMEKELSYISAVGNVLTFHFHDGREVSREYRRVDYRGRKR